MTAAAWRSLTLEAARLDREAESPLIVAEPEGESRQAAPLDDHEWRERLDRRERLERLRDVLRHAVVVDGQADGQAVIGRRVSFVDDDGCRTSYALVTPGEGDPLLGWVSVGSPLGAALLGARAGDVVTVDAPAGSRRVIVSGVTEPTLPGEPDGFGPESGHR